jgi:hypothetical protein
MVPNPHVTARFHIVKPSKMWASFYAASFLLLFYARVNDLMKVGDEPVK